MTPNKKTRRQWRRKMDMKKILEDKESETAILAESPDGRIFGYGNPNVKTIMAQYLGSEINHGPKTWCYTKDDDDDDNDNEGHWWDVPVIVGNWRREIDVRIALLDVLTTSLNAKVAELDMLIKSLSLD